MNKSKNLIYSFLICVTFVDFNDCITVSNDQISIKSDHIKNHVTQKSGDMSVEKSHSSIMKESIATGVMDAIDKTSLNKRKKGHILFFHQLGTKSHIFLQKSLVEGLLERGHQVTTVFYVKTSIVHENYTEVLIKDRSEEMFQKVSKLAMESGGSKLSPTYLYKTFKVFLEYGSTTCSEAINESDILMEIIKERKNVDAVIGMSTCSVFLSHILNATFISLSPVGPIPLFLKGFGDATNPFIQPHPILTSIEPLSFFDKIKNILLGSSWNAFIVYLSNLERIILEESIGGPIPPFQDILIERSSFYLTNSHFVTHGNWPYYKNVVEIGGSHLKPGKALPLELQKYMDSHPEGVIYVSFGSAFKPSEMKIEQKMAFIETFRMLNSPIIWKWNGDDLSEIPDNVRIETWLPQNDLLAHPNLKVFVTHGGLLSIQEALYHGIPLVGVPLAQDQISNVIRAEKNGFAIKVALENLSVETLVPAIKSAMNDIKMKASIEKMHNLFISADVHGKLPLERGIDTVEYVIKHRTCDFLKSHPLQTPWFIYFGYDLLIVLLVVIGMTAVIISKILIYCIGKFCKKKTKQE